MIRCSECKSSIVEAIAFNDWLKLVNFIQFLHLEGNIEQATHDSLMDALQTLKVLVVRNEDKQMQEYVNNTISDILRNPPPEFLQNVIALVGKERIISIINQNENNT